jgi:hypothetical protein
MMNGDFYRVYIVNKPAWLSCGRVYVTDLENRIVLSEERMGKSPVVRHCEGRHALPYSLSPYPYKEMNNRPIRVHTKVFPSSLVDLPSGEITLSADEIVSVMRVFLVPGQDLMSYISEYNLVSKDQRSKYFEALKPILSERSKSIKKVEDKFKVKKASLEKKHAEPDLVDLVQAKRRKR